MHKIDNRSTNLVYHITFRVPTFVAHVTIDLHELLENRTVAAGALGCEAGRIMKMTVYVPIMLIIRVLWSEQGGTEGTCKVFHMEFLVCNGDK
jgi:hypothetical protein